MMVELKKISIFAWLNNKKMKIRIKICRLCFLVLGCVHLHGQNIGQQQLTDNSAADYLRIVDKQSPLYYGKIYEGHLRTTNHPFLKDEQFAKARLSYCRVIYPEVLLRLDLYRNELGIQSSDYQNIILFPENLDYAELHGQTIIYFRRDSLPGCPSTGYYTLLYSGNCKVLEKQTAVLQVTNDGNSRTTQHYVFSTRYYLYKDGVYYPIRSRRGLLNVLHPHKKELKRFISSHGWQFRFRNDAERFIFLTVSEYEKLSGW